MGGGSGGAGGTTAGTGGNGTGGGGSGDGGTMAGTGSGGTEGTEAGTGGAGMAQDADCDMNGLWISRMLTVTDALNADQCASIYAFYELRHEGANVEVVNHFECGLTARGSGVPNCAQPTREAILLRNVQTWKTSDRYKIMPSMTWDTDIEARASYIEEIALKAYNEQGEPDGFLTTLAVPQPQGG